MNGTQTRDAAELVAIQQTVLETARAMARARARFPDGTTCALCGASNPFVLVAGSWPIRCYACTVAHEIERDHPAGHHRGATLDLPTNLHRVRSEQERVMRLVPLAGVRPELAAALGAYAVLRLLSLGSSGESL